MLRERLPGCSLFYLVYEKFFDLHIISLPADPVGIFSAERTFFSKAYLHLTPELACYSALYLRSL
jgi:hypothetical protein